MDEDEDEVFGNNWSSPAVRQIKQESRATQTVSNPLLHSNGMLPCGVPHEPTQLFYGSAGLLLQSAPCSPPQRVREARLQEVMEEEGPRGRIDRLHQQELPSLEVQIGQKLQMIGDQFHQDQMLHLQNQGNQRPFWLRLAFELYTLLFEG